MRTVAIPVREADVQRLITDAAERLGYSWVHHRPAQTAHGWRTPTSGPLGKGWPDLTLIRPRDQRVMFIEVKGPAGRLSPAQREVLELLLAAGQVVRIVGPDDVDALIEELR